MRTPAEFEALVQQIRPELHRYCARMVGSAIDAEDIVQEALAKAYAALPTTSVTTMRGWLFRIAHNTAIDHLRRASQHPTDYLDERTVVADPGPPLDEGELMSLALTLFVKLAPRQRSCVILKDVMGCSLAEISELLDATVPEIKAALHRGRTRLRQLAAGARGGGPVAIDEEERALLGRYIERFNARDFDAVRAMLADEVRLELFNRASRRGAAAVGEYFARYDMSDDWSLAPGWVEGRPAILVSDPRAPSARPAYAMLIAWEAGRVAYIRDYRYTPYVLDGVDMVEGSR